MGLRSAALVGCVLLSLLALQACHVAAQAYGEADPGATEGAATTAETSSSAFPGGETAEEGTASEAAGDEGEGEEVGGMRSGGDPADAEDMAQGVTPTSSSTEGTPAGTQGKMDATEGEGATEGAEGTPAEGGADAPGGVDAASAGMGDESAAATYNATASGNTYNFTRSWKDIQHGDLKEETILGGVIGAVVGMSFCLCFVGVCYIRQRNIARAQYGAPQGGAIEL